MASGNGGNGNNGGNRAQPIQAPQQTAQPLREGIDEDKASLIARLEAAEKRLALAQEQVADAEKRAEEADAARREAESLGGRRLAGEDKPLYVKGGCYKFTVGPIKPHPTYPHLVPKTVETVDESEAIRWYCENHEMQPGSNRAVDREKIKIVATCLEKTKRSSIIALKNRLSALRVKVLQGSVLNAEEEKLVKDFEGEVYGFAND